MEKKPNVVIIMADQLRYDMLEKGITPNIRQIAEEGVEFCIKYGNLVILPRLLFNKACALAELGQKGEAVKYFRQSVVLFETMKQNERACRAADYCKNNYGIEF